MNRVGILVSVLALAGCRQLFGIDDTVVPEDAFVSPDGVVPDAGPLGPWGPPQIVMFPSGLGPSDDDPALTADLCELFFSRRMGGDPDIWVVTRPAVDDAWGQPALVDELSSPAEDGTPALSADGLTIYLSSSRTGGEGSSDIWIATRADRSSPWTTPIHAPDLSGAEQDLVGGPDATGDQLAMSRIDTNHLNLYLATRPMPSSPFVFTAIAGADTPASDEAGSLSPDARFLYFASNIGGGDMDLYLVQRSAASLAFGAPERIEELSSTSSDIDIWVSPDQRHAFFLSDRSGVWALYESSR